MPLVIIMTRRPSNPKSGKPFKLTLIAPGEIVEKVDAMAARLRAETPGKAVTRTDIVRMAVYAFVK